MTVVRCSEIHPVLDVQVEGVIAIQGTTVTIP